MEVFARGINHFWSDDEFENLLRPYMGNVGINAFRCRKTVKKPNCATIVIPSSEAGARFLNLHGKGPTGITHTPLCLGGWFVIFAQSRFPPDPMVVKRLLNTASLQSGSKDASENTPSKRTFDVASLQCGYLGYQGPRLAFSGCYTDARNGSVIFGRKALVVILKNPTNPEKTARVLMKYSSIEKIISGTLTESTLSLVLREPPLLHNVVEANGTGQVSPLFARLSLFRPTENQTLTSRVCFLAPSHAACVGRCLTYQIRLFTANDLIAISYILGKTLGSPRVIRSSVISIVNTQSFSQTLKTFLSHLGSSELPFSVKFQIQMLGENAIIPVSTTINLIEPIEKLLKESRESALVQAIRRFAKAIPYPGPDIDPHVYSLERIIRSITEFTKGYRYRGSIYHQSRRHQLGLIHKVWVTPCGFYLEGPELDTLNRVLRKYKSHIDHFIRVSFLDENGEIIMYEPNVDRDPVFLARFRNVLNEGINIGGRKYAFLGFSHSSLRSQQAWFMAPFYDGDELLIPSRLISRLGEFGHIRIPAKCAARIGQTFSDATHVITVDDSSIQNIPDIERNGRTFTDGVGMISQEQIKRLWKVFRKARKQKASILQIRFQGAKGILVLNADLKGDQILLRPSQQKFPGSSDLTLEIVEGGFRPLPMFLNKQLIMVLEGLGVAPESFLALQQQALSSLRETLTSTIKAAKFLEDNHFGLSARLPALLRFLHRLVHDYKEDDFLQKAVEMAMMTTLRELKHRARIPVEKGHTLFGTVDETAQLREGQVHVAIKRKSSLTEWLIGRAAITRCPCMHPGDIQLVDVVEPPSESPLRELHNCVIFSQHGGRDLPSKLSGGDLDGDLYNVIFDESLIPKFTYTPADYPRIEAIAIDRPVEAMDMSDFFIKFMQTDRLGYISNAHLTLADQVSSEAKKNAGISLLPNKNGIFSDGCIKLAGMASTAVDFSKTGVEVSFNHFFPTCRVCEVQLSD